jgi:hypothetical protein
MKWSLYKIPKILYMYWGRNKPLSYMRLLTVLSFVKLNPDWQVHIYYPAESVVEEPWRTQEQKINAPTEDYFKELSFIPGVTLLTAIFPDIIESMAEVHRSDYLRWTLLAKGGVWSDFDILFIRPMECLPFNDDYHKDIDVVTCYCRSRNNEWNAIGFLLGGAELKYSFFREIANRTLLIRGVSDYQFMGRLLMDEYFKFSTDLVEILWQQLRIRVHNMPTCCVYPTYKPELYYRSKEFFFENETIGLHWFAGSAISGHYENRVTKDNIEGFNRVFLFRKAMEVIGG